jgi:hypothetical protein
MSRCFVGAQNQNRVGRDKGQCEKEASDSHALKTHRWKERRAAEDTQQYCTHLAYYDALGFISSFIVCASYPNCPCSCKKIEKERD